MATILRGSNLPALPTGTGHRRMHRWETRMLLKHYLDQGAGKAELSRRFGVSRRTIHHWIATGQLDRDLAAGRTEAAARRRRSCDGRAGSDTARRRAGGDKRWRICRKFSHPTAACRSVGAERNRGQVLRSSSSHPFRPCGRRRHCSLGVPLVSGTSGPPLRRSPVSVSWGVLGIELDHWVFRGLAPILGLRAVSRICQPALRPSTFLIRYDLDMSRGRSPVLDTPERGWKSKLLAQQERSSGR